MTILPGGKEKAATALKNVIAKHGDTPAAKLAQKTLEDLGASSSSAEATESSEETVSARPTRSRTGATASSSSAGSARKKAASTLKLAKFYLAKKPEKAKEYAEKVIEMAPDTSEAEEAQQLLDELK
jgi:TolA-binding protein